MSDNARRTGPAVEAHFQFLTWLVPTIEKFPRSQKFTLGDRIHATALDVLEALIEATYTRDRRPPSSVVVANTPCLTRTRTPRFFLIPAGNSARRRYFARTSPL